MASIDPSIISEPEEDDKWVVVIEKILDHELQIDDETPPVLLFHVPETITSKKPEAYEPQQIGLGPIHHFRPQPYMKMEQKKLGVIRHLLKDYRIKDYKLQILYRVEKLVPIVRSCYDMFLQHNQDSLARIFAIDGLFLLNLFRTYNTPIEQHLILLQNKAYEVKSSKNDEFQSQKEIVVTVENQIEWENILHVPHHQPKVGPKKRLVAQDVMMVENQIPFMVLKVINETLRSSSGNSSHSVVNLSPSVYRVFCEVHSPLKLCSMSQAPCSEDHLLGYMYYSIINNVQTHKLHDHDDIEKPDFYTPKLRTKFVTDVYDFITKIPKEEIAQAYEQTVSMLETFTKNETFIPSASILHHKAKFQFRSLEEDQGIRNIRIQGKDVYLPSINLNNDSDVILRNLVAYEALMVNSVCFPLNEYMGMMCGLITNKYDVEYLKSQNVITGDLGEDEVVKLFTGMGGSIPTAKTKGSSILGYTIDEINKVYKSGLRMKAYLLLKQPARLLLVVLKAIGTFVESSWKIVAYLISIIAVFLLTAQAYCDVFGCNKNTVTTLLPVASG